MRCWARNHLAAKQSTFERSNQASASGRQRESTRLAGDRSTPLVPPHSANVQLDVPTAQHGDPAGLERLPWLVVVHDRATHTVPDADTNCIRGLPVDREDGERI